MSTTTVEFMDFWTELPL